jgi:hypothetical protein
MREGSKEHIKSMDIAAPQIMDVNAQDEVRRTLAQLRRRLHHSRPYAIRPRCTSRSSRIASRRRIVLGDWYEQGSVLRWDRARLCIGAIGLRL